MILSRIKQVFGRGDAGTRVAQPLLAAPRCGVDSFASALVGGRSLSGVRCTFVGRSNDPLIGRLTAIGCDVTVLPIDDASAERRFDVHHPWRHGAPEPADVLVTRGALATCGQPSALLAWFRQVAPTLCVDVERAATDHALGHEARHDELERIWFGLGEPPAARTRHWLDRELGRLDYHTTTGVLDVDVDSESVAFALAERYDAPRDNTPVLVHVHLPKNGGTSLNRALDTSFGANHVPMYFGQPQQQHDLQTIARTLWLHPDAECISSHSFKVFPHLLGNRLPLYMCFLREPIARHKSYYRYCRQNWDELNPTHREQLLPPDFLDMDLPTFLRWQGKKERKQSLTANHQVQFLTRSASAKRAIHTLEPFFFVGLTEQLERGLCVLQRKLEPYGLELKLPDATHANRTDRPAAHDELEWDEAAYGSVRADQQLYAWAVERFEREAAEWNL